MFDNEKELMRPSERREYECELQLSYDPRRPFHITNWTYRLKGFGGTIWNMCEDHNFWTQDASDGKISVEDLQLVIRIFEEIDARRDVANTVNDRLLPWGYRVEVAALSGLLLWNPETGVHLTVDKNGAGAAEAPVPEVLEQELEAISALYFA